MRCVDLDGEDWFENELTGDVYYCRDYQKGDEKLIDGEGWKWMGKNDMFGKSADDVITDNLDKADVYTQGDTYDRVRFSGTNAKSFMDNMGYKNVPTQVIEYEKSIVQRTWTPAGTQSVDIGGLFQIVEKVGYVNKDFKETSRKQVGSSMCSTRNECIETVSRKKIEYGKPYSKIGNFLNTVFGGNIDLKNIGPCTPNWTLIKDFIKR